MTNKIIFLIAMLLTSISALQAQNNVGIGTNTPDSSAALDISSTNKGLLIPRVNLADVNTIAPLNSVTPGLLVYNTNLYIANGFGKGFYYWNGSKWLNMLSSSISFDYWTKYGNSIGNNSGAYIGTNDDEDVVFRRDGIFAGHIGISNTSFGKNSLTGTSNYYNSAFGSYSLYENTTGDINSAFGYAALNSNVSGDSNVAMGFVALGFNTTGKNNVSIGSSSCSYNEEGSYNTAVGYKTGVQSISLGGSENYNTTIGAYATVAPLISKATAIGAHASATDSNTLVLGGTGAFKVKVGIGTSSPDTDLDILQSAGISRGIRLRHATLFNNHWTTYVDDAADYNFAFLGTLKSYINDVNGQYVAVSDRRLKKDISDVKNVLPNLLKLQAKTYHYKDNKEGAPISYGFIAQEVEKLFPEFVDTKEDTGMKAIAYDNFAVISIQAIKEQQAIIDQQKKEMELLKKEMQELRNLITTRNK